ncbi:MAG: L-rhamnose mutarotase [Bacteroidales bacterium]|nr:L-rhamnose mutarotase [Bacteroidales bacterium]
MKRFGFKMKLNPGFREEYRKRHNEIWPELVKLLKDQGIGNYSIFLDEETNILFAYQEQSGASSSQDLGTTEIVKKWWKYMADIMETNQDNSPVTVPLDEVFHMD